MIYEISEDLILRSMTMEDYPDAFRITEGRFGKGYMKQAEFTEWIRNPELCLCAIYKDCFAGLFYLMPEPPEDLAAFLKLDVGDIRAFAEGKPTLHCRCAALDPAFEGNGIMYHLHVREFQNAADMGFGAIYAPCWKYGDKIPMARTMEKFGFEYVCEQKNLWYDAEDYECIVCRGRCVCPAAIYRKKL